MPHEAIKVTKVSCTQIGTPGRRAYSQRRQCSTGSTGGDKQHLANNQGNKLWRNTCRQQRTPGQVRDNLRRRRPVVSLPRGSQEAIGVGGTPHTLPRRSTGKGNSTSEKKSEQLPVYCHPSRPWTKHAHENIHRRKQMFQQIRVHYPSSPQTHTK